MTQAVENDFSYQPTSERATWTVEKPLRIVRQFHSRAYQIHSGKSGLTSAAHLCCCFATA